MYVNSRYVKWKYYLYYRLLADQLLEILPPLLQWISLNYQVLSANGSKKGKQW